VAKRRTSPVSGRRSRASRTAFPSWSLGTRSRESEVARLRESEGARERESEGERGARFKNGSECGCTLAFAKHYCPPHKRARAGLASNYFIYPARVIATLDPGAMGMCTTSSTFSSLGTDQKTETARKTTTGQGFCFSHSLGA